MAICVSITHQLTVPISYIMECSDVVVLSSCDSNKNIVTLLEEIGFFLDVIPCNLVGEDRRFGGAFRLILRS